MRRAHRLVRMLAELVGTLSLCPPYEDERLLIPRIEIFAGRGRRGHAVGTRAMRPAAPARETLAATTLFISAGRAIHLRLRAGDEGGQPIDVAFGGRVALLQARLVRLALLVLRERLCVARDIGLRLSGTVRRIG